MEAFLAQFYADKPAPPLILLNVKPENASIIQQALTEHTGHKVALATPASGDKKRLVDLAESNAREALARHRAERAQQTHLLARVSEVFGLPEPPKRIEVYDNSHISGAMRLAR